MIKEKSNLKSSLILVLAIIVLTILYWLFRGK